ncbi:16668_t:CDS:1, partial [Gigaspora rosea]
IRKRDQNKMGIKVCTVENFYKAICDAHQATEHRVKRRPGE